MLVLLVMVVGGTASALPAWQTTSIQPQHEPTDGHRVRRIFFLSLESEVSRRDELYANLHAHGFGRAEVRWVPAFTLRVNASDESSPDSDAAVEAQRGLAGSPHLP